MSSAFFTDVSPDHHMKRINMTNSSVIKTVIFSELDTSFPSSVSFDVKTKEGLFDEICHGYQLSDVELESDRDDENNN